MKLRLNIPARNPDPQQRIKKLMADVQDSADDSVLQSPDPIEDALLRSLQGSTDVPEEIVYVFQLYLTQYHREVLEAFLVTGADSGDVYSVLKIDQTVTNIYAEYFFDIDVFRNHLELEDYVRQQCLESNTTRSTYGKQLLSAGLERGLNYLCAKFSHGRYDVPSLSAMNEIITEAYVKFCEAKRGPATSERAKESRQYAKMFVSSLQAMPEIEKMQRGDKNEFLVRLRERIQKKPQEINKEDILS